ncbi:MAG: hypothetical protein J6P87_04105 [Lachnospiraceae bacterium]|nr:hypothetical protein [Lachnospiraceae bacterium]
MLKRFAVTSIFLSILWLCVSGCSFSVTGYDGNHVDIDDVTYEVSTRKNSAFAHSAGWTPGAGPSDIYIADTADGAPVTALGGFTGTGVPCAFSIVPSSDPDTDAGQYISLPPDPSDLGVDITWQDEEITVHLGKNIEKISLPVSTGYAGIRGEDGTIAFYRPVLSFECDPENDVFTDKDGVLCYRKDGSPVKETESAQEPVPSGPVFSELSFSEKICGRYRYDISEEEYAVAEFFTLKSAGSSFMPESLRDAVYANIGRYIDGSLYVYSAAVLTPAEVPVGYINIDPDIARLYEVRCFSSFSQAGQYWDTEPSLYAVSVLEDRLELSGLEVNGNTLISTEDSTESAAGPSFILSRDNDAPSGVPSLFPWDPAVLDDMIYTEERINKAKVMHFRPGYAWLPSFPVKAGPAIVKLNADLTAEVVVIPEDPDTPPEIWRGICEYRYEEKVLDFYLTRLGYAEMPYAGSIEIVWENDAITWRTCDGSEGFPFIPEGDTEVPVLTH